MAQETITDYKTVEEEETITVCDCCGKRDIDEISIAINPTAEVAVEEEFKVVRRFEKESEAIMWERKAKRPELSDFGISKGFEPDGFSGVKETNTEIMGMEASVWGNLCSGCIVDVFDIDIPDDHEVKDIEFGEKEVNITTEETIEHRYPRLNLDRIMWLKAIVFWPLFFIFSVTNIIIEDGDGWSEERNKPTYFLTSSIGAMAWFTLIFIFIYVI